MNAAVVQPLPGFLSRERIVAGPRFNRWLVPPAALAIHLCIGMAYGFSVFWLPLSKSIGITQSVACPKDMSLLAQLFTTQLRLEDFDARAGRTRCSSCCWDSPRRHGAAGSSAPGRARPGVVSAVCWCGGLVISAFGVMTHQLWLMWLGSGVIGGVGLGLGYISPVSTLIKWFPDRRGMATGMAIMGFGGGAMIGSPLADRLMKFYATPDVGRRVGNVPHARGDLLRVHDLRRARLSRAARRLAARRLDAAARTRRGTGSSRSTTCILSVAWRTKQFWLLVGRAVPQRDGGHRHSRHGIAVAAGSVRRTAHRRRRGVHRADSGSAGADRRDRRRLHRAAVAVQHRGPHFLGVAVRSHRAQGDVRGVLPARHRAVLRRFPWTAAAGSLALFVAFFCVILSMYGGGFATIPAYLADLFGTQMVGAIHGRLLTAWSVAGILGPVIVNYIREYQIDHGVARANAYSITMYVLAALLAAGFLCNWLVKPVAEKHYLTDDGVSAKAATVAAATPTARAGEPAEIAGGSLVFVVLAWAAVWIPIGWGVWVTLGKAVVLFR